MFVHGLLRQSPAYEDSQTSNPAGRFLRLRIFVRCYRAVRISFFSRRVPLSFSYSAIDICLVSPSANLRKISPRTGIEYSLGLRSELARSLSAAAQRSFSSCLSCSFVIRSGPLTVARSSGANASGSFFRLKAGKRERRTTKVSCEPLLWPFLSIGVLLALAVSAENGRTWEKVKKELNAPDATNHQLALLHAQRPQIPLARKQIISTAVTSRMKRMIFTFMDVR